MKKMSLSHPLLLVAFVFVPLLALAACGQKEECQPAAPQTTSGQTTSGGAPVPAYTCTPASDTGALNDCFRHPDNPGCPQ